MTTKGLNPQFIFTVLEAWSSLPEERCKVRKQPTTCLQPPNHSAHAATSDAFQNSYLS